MDDEVSRRETADVSTHDGVAEYRYPIAHVAVGVESTDEAFEALLEHRDPPIVENPTTMEQIDRRVAFVEDPNGYVVELVERL